ncbi:MAG TPA: hypothetical protein VE592_07855 [Geminicoccaceae bacterium]|nr:hypothetical protein [Geminicoccaceae bacterium]
MFQRGDGKRGVVADVPRFITRELRSGCSHPRPRGPSLASILLSPSRALPGDLIGVPVGVMFSRAVGVTLMVANLKMRLGDLAPAALAALFSA